MSEDIEQLNVVEEVLKVVAVDNETKQEDNVQVNNLESNSVGMDQQETKSTTDSINNKHHIDIYLTSFIHSIYCRVNNCTFNNCLQFKRILQHSKNCQKIKTNQCEPCRQLITLCIYHAKNCSDDTCRLPLCSSIKRKLRENEEFKLALQFITNSIDLLKSKIDKETQVCNTLITNKRKHFEIENDQNDIEMCLMNENTSFKELNLEKQLLLERFKRIEENLNIESMNIEKLTKNTRLELVKTFYQQCYNDFLKVDSDTTCNANFVALLLRQEQFINKMTQNVDDYLHLLTYYFFQIIKRLEARKQLKSIEVQVDFNNSENEAQQSNGYEDGSNKRIKID